MGNQATKQKEGKLTGTAADLRRLKVPALKEKLRAIGVPEEVLQSGRRWELVDLLRWARLLFPPLGATSCSSRVLFETACFGTLQQ